MEYNNYRIFKWNPYYIGLRNSSNNYNDVLVNTGTNKKLEWQNVIAITSFNGKPEVIYDTNHYLESQHEWSSSYNAEHKIYDNLIVNYIDILNNHQESNKIFYNDQTYFSLLDAFAFSNSGHNLSETISRANYLLNGCQCKNLLIYKGYKKTNNFRLITMLLPEDEYNYIELDFETIYCFKNIIITYPAIMHTERFPELTEKIKSNVITKYGDLYEEFKNKKIILMKTHRTSVVFNHSTHFTCEDFLCGLEKLGYIYVRPEDYDDYRLFIYMIFADTIVYSSGSILYTNKWFFNYDAKLVYMCLPGQRDCCTDNKLLENSLVITVEKTVDNYEEVIQQIENYKR